MDKAMTPDLDKIADEVRKSFADVPTWRQFLRRAVGCIQREQKACAEVKLVPAEAKYGLGIEYSLEAFFDAEALKAGLVGDGTKLYADFPPATPSAVRHWSDCSSNNAGCPELLGPCDCGGYTPSVVPPGWQLVPKEPTGDMCLSASDYQNSPRACERIYQKMLSAAPAPAGENKEGE